MSPPNETAPSKQAFERRVEEVKPCKSDINYVVMDYLINEGYPEAAKKFAAEANIAQRPGDIEHIQERLEIRNAILSGDIKTAIERINDVAPELLDNETPLHFSLLRLQLIELIRNCTSPNSSNTDITPALQFATTHLSPLAPTDQTFLQDLERTMALLIFPADNLTPPLKGLLEPALREEVAARVNEAVLAQMEERGEARLKGLVRLRAWAERRARERKTVPRDGTGLDLWGRTGNGAEDSIMGGQGVDEARRTETEAMAS